MAQVHGSVAYRGSPAPGANACIGAPPRIRTPLPHRPVAMLKGIATSISPDRTRLISILLSNSRLPGHLSPDLWHSMLIILILLIHATTRQQWNASWQSKRRRSAHILSTAIVTVALATRTGMKRVGTRPDGRRCHVPVWKWWNTASYIFGSRMLRPSTDIPARIILP